MEYDPKTEEIQLQPMQLETINLDELKLADIKLHQVERKIDETMSSPIYFHRTSGWTIITYLLIISFIIYYVLAKLIPKWKRGPTSSIDQVGLQN